ncbi:SusC/RagA family TonB-linked outer membrane protein [Pedobacter soli]|uniref:TonB-linked outer membrane protein, SusC/RagA family n=1 Tax=Pedobacter soli TaxID=390242 RepID=A0A1G6V8W6_9SPHI|nr:SusC/RagA family TonB-linked outer membrane protein [Pedobacter soli]SDD50022.1 TonB-linked outer membrane protein, SusC/RagA family [Pedobacter soli]
MKQFTQTLKRGIVLMLVGVSIAAGAFAQQNSIPLADALNLIAKKYNAKFAYEHRIVQGKTADRNEASKAKNLEEALKDVLYPNNLLFLYVSEGNYTIVTRDTKTSLSVIIEPNAAKVNDKSNEHYITGRVEDENGNPMPGATLKTNATNQTFLTNSSGEFAMFVSPDATELSVYYLGYEPFSQKINANTKSLRMVLKATVNQLEEVNVVSTGYQKISKERATGAATVITAKELEKVPVPNVLYRLETMVPGVKITLNSGDNSFVYGNTMNAINGGTRTRGTSDYGMTVRGRGSLPGPQGSESFPLIVIDGAISENDISTINPDDVESITFLKDAAAASIWGVRSGNGVMVITTKRGKNNQAPVINFSVNAAVSNHPDLNKLPLMNAAQTIAFEQELVNKNLIIAPSNTTPMGQPLATVTDLTFKLKAGTISQSDYNTAIARYSTMDNRSQVADYLLRPANNQVYNFSVSGGNNYSNYFYSASYANENPYAVGNNGQRLTVTLNNTFKLFKVATLSTNVKGAFLKYKNNGISLNTLYAPSATAFMPYDQLVDDNGNRVAYSRRYYAGWVNTLYPKGFLNWGYNALDEVENADNTQKDNNYSVNLNLSVPVFKGLTANAFYANEFGFSNARRYYNEQSFYYRDFVNGYTPIPTTGNATNSIGLAKGAGILNSQNTTANNYTLRGQLNYDRTFGADHQVTAIAGSEIRETNAGQTTGTLYGYNTGTGLSRPVDFFTPYPTIAGYSSSLSGSYPTLQDKKRRFLSYYSNAAYTYKSKYTLSGSVRYDDYNNFGLDRSFRATPLYSFGAKWDAYKETFLKNVSWISNLSLRGTYGVNGNISTQLFPFTWISVGAADLTTGLPYASIISPANPELRWEKTYMSNIAIDFGFLKNRLSGSVDFYHKDGKDLLYQFPINGTYGVTTLTRNSTRMTGKGVDVALNGIIYTAKDWDITSRLNYAYNTNNVEDTRFVPTSSFYANPAYGSLLAGYPSDKIFVYRNAGLDATGMTLVYDENGNKVAANQNVTNVAALKYAGRSAPSHFGSFIQSVRYKDFTLMAVASYQFGSVFLKPTASSYSSSRLGVKYDLHEDVASRWQKAGDEATTNVPGMAGTFAGTSLLRYQQSDINVLKGDYIRLRELSLSYRIPTEKITSKIKGATFGFNVRNLGLIWTANKAGLDPDVLPNLSSTTLGLPPTVSYNFSLNLNF